MKLSFLYLFLDFLIGSAMYKGLVIIFGFLFLGEVVVELVNLPIPGNVVGMILLTFALVFKAVRLEDVEREAEFLVKNMSVMFVPPGVGIVLYWGLIKAQALPIFGALILSFFVTIILTAKLVEALK